MGAWFLKIDFSTILGVATINTFRKTKLCCRTLAPELDKHIEEGFCKWKEEDRLQKVMWEVLERSCVLEGHKKKAFARLNKSYDDAHLSASYGSSVAETPQMGMLQDFVKGWMLEFVMQTWTVLEHGIGATCRDEQVLFVTMLFQALCDPGVACLPHDIMSAVPAIPSAPWGYVAEAAEAVFRELDSMTEEEPAFKKQKPNQPIGLVLPQ